MSRDFCGDMAAEIEAATAGGPYVPRTVADELVDKLRATDPDLLSGWLDAQAAHMVWQAINDRDRSRRSRVRAQAGRARFAAAVESHEAGDSAALREWLDMPFTIGDGTRTPLGELRKADLLFVADGYQRRVDDNQMWASFMRALAKKVGRGTVADHYSEDQLSAMFGSLRAA